MLLISTAPVFEDDPDAPPTGYAYDIGTGTIVRASGLSIDPTGFSGAIAVNTSASTAVFASGGRRDGGNVDLSLEAWIIQNAAQPQMQISVATPTTLDSDVMPAPLRYDFIRGDVATLGAGGNLGPVTCLENDSGDATTNGYGDTLAPAVGQVFFYLMRGSQGVDDGPGSYGKASDGSERFAGSGGCAN